MRRTVVLALLAFSLLSPNVFSDTGWETAGKILTGVIIGHVATEILRPSCSPPPSPPVCSRKPRYFEYKAYIPGYWHESYVIELIPGYWDMAWIHREDGTIYQDRVWVPPTTRQVPQRTWIPGRWEVRRERYIQ
jgi:hypothetical protein